MASNSGRRLGSLMTSFRSPTSTATSIVLQRHREHLEFHPRPWPLTPKGSQTQQSQAGPPPHWVQALEMERMLLKSPEALTLGQVLRKSLTVSQ